MNMELRPDNMAFKIKEIIENSCDDIFVFPTDVVLNSWTDWIVTHTSKKAVAQERFIAWDNFKSDFISDHQPASDDCPKKTVIPSILRKMFVTDLISRNAMATSDDEKFHEIINPQYADEAKSNADWLCDTLRSLYFWKKRYDNYIENNPGAEVDWEDKDYNLLYKNYKQFLDDRNLFEPSWVEDIKFTESEKRFHIFYPELLEDFADYKELFESLPNICIYFEKLPEGNDGEIDDNNFVYEHPDKTSLERSSSPYVFLYSDARKELRQTMLSIINIVTSSKGQTDWSEIALSVPDIETYRPYIQREFELYGIPYVIKAGISMTKNAAGRVFREIKDCYDSNFSYDSLRTLLLDEYMPWKEEINDIKEILIREGNRMRCICSVTDDIWIKSFEKNIENLNNKIDYYKGKNDKSYEVKIEKTKNKIEEANNALEFYKSFKESILTFYKEDSFENILSSWMSFKKEFFNEDNFTEDENNILSRCIVELKEIINIEKEYPGLINPSRYDFFIQELDKKTYTPQTKITGVNIFPYKLSAAAYFKYQFVIDCSQKSVDVAYKPLAYLSDKKRDALLTEEEKLTNTSEAFIKLYAKQTEAADGRTVHFSASTDSFSGFSIPHNAFNVLDKEYNLDFDEDDYILQEKSIIKSPENHNSKVKLLKSQIESYNNWKKTSIEKDCETYIFNEKIIDSINSSIKLEKNQKPEISARGTLENFFPCPRKWMLKKVLNVKEESSDTNLMNIYDMGQINHKILQLFMNKYINTNKALPFYDEINETFRYKKDNPEVTCEDEINSYLYGENNIVEKAIKNSGIRDFEDSPLAITASLSQKRKIADKIKDFLKFLLLPYGESHVGRYDWENFYGIGNCYVLGTEVSPKKLDLHDFSYNGQIDAYFKNSNGDLIIIDYKNSMGALPKSASIFVDKDKILKDFQMPVYYKLISNKHKDSKIDVCSFYAIKDKIKRQFLDEVSLKLFEENYNKKIATAEQALNTSIEKMDKAFINATNVKTEKQKAEAEEKINKAVLDKEKKENDLELIREKFDNLRKPFENTLQAIDEYGELFVDTINNKDFIPYYSEDVSDTNKIRKSVKNYEDCKECPYKRICRTTFVIAGKTLATK